MSEARGWIGGGGSPRVFVRLIRGRLPTDAEMNFGLRRGFSPELSALDGPAAADEAASPNPGLSLFGGARVAAEAAPTKTDPDSCIRVPIRGRPRTDAEMKPLPPIPGLPFRWRKRSRLKPLLPNADLSVGGAFAPNFRPSMARWLRMKPLPPIPGLLFSMTQKVAAEAAPKEEMDFSSVPPRFATAAASWVKIAFR